MNRLMFQRRTKRFAIDVIRLVESLPSTETSRVIGRQLLRSATSVGANYRAACRARSNAEFVAKMGIVEEEGDESLYWMELLIETGITPESRLEELLKEGNELVAMTVASIRTAKGASRR